MTIVDCTEAIRLNPIIGRTFIVRANAYRNIGQDEKAMADYTQAIKLLPNDSYAFISRGLAYHHKARFDLAIADYNEAIRFAPQWGRPYLEGVCKWLFWDLQQARTNCLVFPGFPRCRAAIDCSRSIYDEGPLGFAVKNGHPAREKRTPITNKTYGESWSQTSAHAKNPSVFCGGKAFANSLLDRGRAFLHKGELLKAISDFTECIRREPQNATAYEGRSCAYNALGDKTKAEKDKHNADELQVYQR